MKRSEKGVLGIILAATLMIGATAVVSANGGTLVDPNSFASKGKIQVKENETDSDPAIVIDSADLVTLANATNELNTQFTDSLAAAVNNIGSVPKTDRVAAGATFSDLLKEIKNSQAIDTSESVYVLQNGTVTDDSTAEGVVEKQITGATEANLTAGTAAWVDGQYIVGTGSDNNSYYALGYTTGVAESLNSANIQYTYHTHTGNSSSKGGCYTTPVYHSHSNSCYYEATKGELVYDGDKIYRRYTCSHCGNSSIQGDGVNDNGSSTIICSYCLNKGDYKCGKSTSTIESYKLSCGKTTASIESAILTFD